MTFKAKTTTSPSWNLTREKLKKERELENTKQAESYHQSKLPKFDVYGEERKIKEQVPSLLRPIAQRELNTKYILIRKFVSFEDTLQLKAQQKEE